MPTDLSFSVPYTSREGTCPTSDWTYHHILPVRYYWSTAYILVKLIRLQQCQNLKSGFDLKAEFGTANAMAFFGDFTIKKQDVIKSCLSLHRTPVNSGAGLKLGANFDSQDLSTEKGIANIVAELTGPRWGGFLGMAPDQRTDDPKSTVEKMKPVGFDETQWTNVQNLGKVLVRCMPNIAGTVNGPYKCTLSVNSATEIITILSELRDITVPNGFTPGDWDMANTKTWYFLVNPAAKPQGITISRMSDCGAIFSLAKAAPANPDPNAAPVVPTNGIKVAMKDLNDGTKRDVMVALSANQEKHLQFVKLA